MQLFKLPDFPSEIAASKTDQYVEGGAFFLDFSRPLRRMRWFFGKINYSFGLAVGLAVPIVHQGESTGGFIASVHRSESAYSQVRALWKQYYPRSRTGPNTAKADGLKVIADFATQFPNDCQ
ncbi:MAG: hypothetical protein WBW93_12350 [Steroidobacteraceae bacterium]